MDNSMELPQKNKSKIDLLYGLKSLTHAAVHGVAKSRTQLSD